MLIHRLETKKQKATPTPKWVKDGKLSERVWQAIESIEHEKAQFIASLKDRKRIVGKRQSTISKKQVADWAGCSPSSLHNRTFSSGLNESLDEANERLKQQYADRLRSLGDVGIKDRRKSEILDQLRATSRELEQLKKRQVAEMVDTVIDRLPLRIRRKLMLD